MAKAALARNRKWLRLSHSKLAREISDAGRVSCAVPLGLKTDPAEESWDAVAAEVGDGAVVGGDGVACAVLEILTPSRQISANQRIYPGADDGGRLPFSLPFEDSSLWMSHANAGGGG